jgi:hypothetical protein
VSRESDKVRALCKVARTAEAVRKNDAEADKRRQARNEAIVEAAEHAPATEIAEAAKIKQSYVSRVIRSGGKPASGSDLDRTREPASA